MLWYQTVLPAPNPCGDNRHIVTCALIYCYSSQPITISSYLKKVIYTLLICIGHYLRCYAFLVKIWQTLPFYGGWKPTLDNHMITTLILRNYERKEGVNLAQFVSHWQREGNNLRGNALKPVRAASKAAIWKTAEAAFTRAQAVPWSQP